MIVRRWPMRPQWAFLMALIFLTGVLVADSDIEENTSAGLNNTEGGEKDEDQDVADCTQTDYSQFRKCIDSHKSKKSPIHPDDDSKSQTLLDHCTDLNSNCVKNCKGDETCEIDCPVCPLNAASLATDALESLHLMQNCTQYTCLSECNSPECQAKCVQNGCILGSTSEKESDSGIHTVIVQQENGNAPSLHRFERNFKPGQNITTIIKLTNLVNNTNHINAPVNISSQDLGLNAAVSLNDSVVTHSMDSDSSEGVINVGPSNHNSSIKSETEKLSSETGGEFGFGFSELGSCCLAIRPKACRASSSGLRCHHRRHRTCGTQCTSRTIHVQLRKRCQQTESVIHSRHRGCENRIAYVPQPQRPSCVYIDQWPYVSCTVQFERHLVEENCHGCYDHYGYGFQRYHEDAETHRVRCRGCYDDAFDYGPLYRRGPVLRPYFYHQAPCFITGGCGGWGVSECGRFGCFGDESVNPAWGHHVTRTHQLDEFEYEYIEGEANNLQNEHEINRLLQTRPEKIQNLSLKSKGLEDSTDDWGVHLHKCKVVSDDGSIEVRNCTDAQVDLNPYAAAPAGVKSKLDLNEESEEIIDELNAEEQNENDDPGEYKRFARSHGKRVQVEPIYDDAEDAGDDFNGSRNKYSQIRRKMLFKRPRKTVQSSRRKLRIVYDDDVDDDDYV